MTCAVRNHSTARLARQVGRLRLVRLALTLRARERARLPRFLGSTLRGGMAHHTRRVCCALQRQRCETCLLAERCAYAVLFETPRPADADRLRTQRYLPHPVVIDPPALQEQQWDPDVPLTFGLSLFGRGVDYVPRLVLAIDEMARGGLGVDRRPFALEAVDAVPLVDSTPAVAVYRPGGRLCEAPVGRLSEALSGTPGEVPSSVPSAKLPEAGGASDDTVTLVLLTPTRLVERGRLTRSPGLGTFTSALLGRASALLYFHDNGEVDVDFRGLVQRAREATTVASELTLQRLKRYSSRQGTSVPLDGLVGRITFSGPAVAELRPLLEAGEILHVGKGTIFGLGKYRIEPSMSERSAPA